MALLPMDYEILPPSDDRVFKLLLTSPDSKPVLIDILSAITGRRVTNVTVRNNELAAEDVDEKGERFDVNCTFEDDDKDQAEIEMQAHPMVEDSTFAHSNLKSRTIYYLCDLHSSQESRGVVNYSKLARTYQITFCAYTVFPEKPGFINSFSLRHDEDSTLLSDDVHIIFVELSKLQEIMEKPVEEMTDLEKWSIFLRFASDASERETVNKVIESKEALQMASELLMSISKDENERAIFRARKKARMDRASDLATAQEIGERRGIEIGERRGEHNSRVEIARRMLRRNRPVEEIAEDTGLTAEEVEALKNE